MAKPITADDLHKRTAAFAGCAAGVPSAARVARRAGRSVRCAAVATAKNTASFWHRSVNRTTQSQTPICATTSHKTPVSTTAWRKGSFPSAGESRRCGDRQRTRWTASLRRCLLAGKVARSVRIALRGRWLCDAVSSRTQTRAITDVGLRTTSVTVTGGDDSAHSRRVFGARRLCCRSRTKMASTR